MAVPGKLKIQPHVYCYSADLLAASNALAGYLKCKVSKVYLNQFDPEYKTAEIAWLVGHGSKGDTKVGNSTGTFGYTINSISKWLQGPGLNYTNLVDTCCYPNRRKNSQPFGNDYYCTNDNECVTVITAYRDLDSWWDASHMHQYVK
jgi:hypothetical protein